MPGTSASGKVQLPHASLGGEVVQITRPHMDNDRDSGIRKNFRIRLHNDDVTTRRQNGVEMMAIRKIRRVSSIDVNAQK